MQSNFSVIIWPWWTTRSSRRFDLKNVLDEYIAFQEQVIIRPGLSTT